VDGPAAITYFAAKTVSSDRPVVVVVGPLKKKSLRSRKMNKPASNEQFAAQQTHEAVESDSSTTVPGEPGDGTEINHGTDLSESGVTRRDGRCRKILDIIG
jgi:hypothetical protein